MRATPDVSIIMPCLNEVGSLPHCITNAKAALALIEKEYGLSGEIVIADKGSTDGSQGLSESLGARVVPVARRGYGAALIGGGEGAAGRFLLMGDADGSYDFRDGVAMIGRLVDGADLCIGKGKCLNVTCAWPSNSLTVSRKTGSRVEQYGH